MGFVLITCFLAFISIDCCLCVTLPKRHVQYISNLIDKFTESNGQLWTGLIQPPCTGVPIDSEHQTSESPPIPEDFLLPVVILWNPLLTYQQVLPNSGQIKCMSCDKVIHTAYWNDGKVSHSHPRVLHDVQDIVLLVSAVYICENGHKIIAHDERILKILPCKFVIPFVLLHQTGFTNEFVRLCTSLCHSGVNFHSFEGIVSNGRWETFESRRQCYLCSLKIYRQSHLDYTITGQNFPTFESYCEKYLPSDDIIRKCFLSKFMEEEQAYICDIQSVKTGEMLSFDHTFKIASNVGYVRHDKKWICQYDSAFLVFNTDGSIVSWQFTKGTNFDNVRKLLQQIHDRSKEQGFCINTVYVDNCCHWRQKIQQVFGSNVSVLLDVFHAVQRISKKIPKRHPFRATCMHDLRLVFRSSCDYGVKRTMPTPEPTQLMKNLNSFCEKWKDVNYNGYHVLSMEAQSEIEKLKLHVQKGCLSGISVGGGTNHNEAFHRYVNTFFNKSRIGILLAYALMMTIVYQYNNRNLKSRKAIYKPVIASRSSQYYVKEIMGVMPNDKETMDCTWLQEQSEDETCTDSMTMNNIVLVSISQLSAYRILKGQTTTATQLWKYIPYLRVLPHCTWQQPLSIDHESETEARRGRLKNWISSWNLRILPVQPDGNCFFTSIALAMVQNIDKIKPLLNVLGIEFNGPITALSMKLREILVQEWLGPNRHEYQSFITNQESYETEALKFLLNGYFNSELGNTMPLGIANALKVSIVIFTSQQNSPVYFVTPNEGSPNDIVLYLAYSSVGLGHYDALIPKDDMSTSVHCKLSTKVATKCRCGINSKQSSKENYLSCSHSNGRHSSCKCLSSGKACSRYCGCKGCSNPNGKRPIESKKREREPHTWQLIDITNRMFMENKGEDKAHGGWSELENVIFSNVFQHLERNMMERDSASLLSLFNSVVRYVNAPHTSFELPINSVLRHKSKEQIEGKIRHFNRERELFEQLNTS